MTTIFHNPRCSKSRAALDLLHSRGIEFEVIRYLDTPPSKKELVEIIALLRIQPAQLVRKGEKLFKELNLVDQEFNRRAVD